MFVGCTWQATGRPWSVSDYAAQVGTLGMYGMIKGDRDNAEVAAQRREIDVDRCVTQGGDPAACRAAVYGTLAPRTNVNVNVR